MNLPISIFEKMRKIEEKPWTPIDVAKVNENVIRLALFEGEYHWHKHDQEDELFFVYKGKIEILIKDKEKIVLEEGDMLVIPRGTEHKPISKEKSYVLLFEPLKLKSTGD